MRTYSANGIILRRIDLGETDRILTVFTREYGKLSAVAKGSRRPGSKLAGASEPFTYEKMFLSRGRELDILTQADIKESFPNVKADISSIAYAVYTLELTNSFIDERQPNPDLFDTLLSTMYVLESGVDPEITTRYFELHLLSILGYQPNFEVCLRCGKQLMALKSRTTANNKIAFSPSLGGFVCKECDQQPGDAIKVSSAIISYIQALLRAEPHKLKEMRMPPGARRDLRNILKWHIRYRLEHELKSIDFINAIDNI